MGSANSILEQQATSFITTYGNRQQHKASRLLSLPATTALLAAISSWSRGFFHHNLPNMACRSTDLAQRPTTSRSAALISTIISTRRRTGMRRVTPLHWNPRKVISPKPPGTILAPTRSWEILISPSAPIPKPTAIIPTYRNLRLQLGEAAARAIAPHPRVQLYRAVAVVIPNPYGKRHQASPTMESVTCQMSRCLPATVSLTASI